MVLLAFLNRNFCVCIGLPFFLLNRKRRLRFKTSFLSKSVNVYFCELHCTVFGLADEPGLVLCLKVPFTAPFEFDATLVFLKVPFTALLEAEFIFVFLKAPFTALLEAEFTFVLKVPFTAPVDIDLPATIEWLLREFVFPPAILFFPPLPLCAIVTFAKINVLATSTTRKLIKFFILIGFKFCFS